MEIKRYIFYLVCIILILYGFNCGSSGYNSDDEPVYIDPCEDIKSEYEGEIENNNIKIFNLEERISELESEIEQLQLDYENLEIDYDNLVVDYNNCCY